MVGIYDIRSGLGKLVTLVTTNSKSPDYDDICTITDLATGFHSNLCAYGNKPLAKVGGVIKTAAIELLSTIESGDLTKVGAKKELKSILTKLSECNEYVENIITDLEFELEKKNPEVAAAVRVNRKVNLDEVAVTKKQESVIEKYLGQRNAAELNKLAKLVDRYSDAEPTIPRKLPNGSNFMDFEAPLLVYTNPGLREGALYRVGFGSTQLIYPATILDSQMIVAVTRETANSNNFATFRKQLVQILNEEYETDYVDMLAEADTVFTYKGCPGMVFLWLLRKADYHILGSFTVETVNFPFGTQFTQPATSKGPDFAALRAARLARDAQIKTLTSEDEAKLEVYQQKVEAILDAVRAAQETKWKAEGKTGTWLSTVVEETDVKEREALEAVMVGKQAKNYGILRNNIKIVRARIRATVDEIKNG